MLYYNHSCTDFLHSVGIYVIIFGVYYLVFCTVRMPKFTRHVGPLSERKFEELQEYLGNGKPFLLFAIKSIPAKQSFICSYCN